MKINIAHIRHPSDKGTQLNLAVFEAKPNLVNEKNNQLLLESLTLKARAAGLNIDQAALAYRHNNQLQYWGSKTLVDWLSKNGLPAWTNTIDA